MGVEFFPCDRCGDTICDAGSWWTCDVCGERLCGDCEDETAATNDEAEEGRPNPGCPFCRRDDATAVALLNFAMERLGLAYDQLMEQYRAARPPMPESDGPEEGLTDG